MKTYYCKRIEKDFDLDGDVDKDVWSKAETVWLVDTMTGNKPRQGTAAKILRSNNYLYVAFKCADSYIHAEMTGYNDPIYKEEVVEVFIDDNSDLKTYIEIEVSPLNTLLHISAHNSLTGNILLFNRAQETVKSFVKRNDAESVWSTEIAIPFNEFATAQHIPPVAGDCWGLNLYRIDRPKDGTDEFTAWSPTVVRKFHTPEKFGQLVFIE